MTKLLYQGALDAADQAGPGTVNSSLEPTGLNPRGATSIAGVRNQLLQYKRALQLHDVEDVRSTALAFVDKVDQLYEWVDDPEQRVFPRVIRIDEVRFDRRRRWTVRVTSDDGMTESLFTDQPVESGAVHLMHPRTTRSGSTPSW